MLLGLNEIPYQWTARDPVRPPGVVLALAVILHLAEGGLTLLALALTLLPIPVLDHDLLSRTEQGRQRDPYLELGRERGV